MRTWKGPKLPRGLLHEMFEVREDGGYYDKQNGGQWVPGEASEEAFQGVVMPLNNEDLKYMDAGTYTINAQKVYTNGIRFASELNSETDMTDSSIPLSRSSRMAPYTP